MSNINQYPQPKTSSDVTVEAEVLSTDESSSALGRVSLEETIKRVSEEWGSNYPDLGEELRGN